MPERTGTQTNVVLLFWKIEKPLRNLTNLEEEDDTRTRENYLLNEP